MLPGRRAFTDDDIVQTITEAQQIFVRCDHKLTIPDDLRPIVLQTIINMVGQREITHGVPSLATPGRML